MDITKEQAIERISTLVSRFDENGGRVELDGLDCERLLAAAIEVLATTKPREVGTPATFDCYQRSDDKWAWRLVVDSNLGPNVVATDGSQGYENHAEAIRVGLKVVNGGYDVNVEP